MPQAFEIKKGTTPLLKPGDMVDIIAPSYGSKTDLLDRALLLLEAWGLRGRVLTELFGPDPFYANSRARRLEGLTSALLSADSQSVWCLQGGAGATSLIPALLELCPPPRQKLFIGFSDATCLHLFLNQKWGWETLHASTLKSLITSADAGTLEALRILLENTSQTPLTDLVPLNEPGECHRHCQGRVTGGNLSLIQASIGTAWQIESAGKIVFVEDVDEKPYRTLERLIHLKQAGLFDQCTALIFFDFTYNTPVEEQHHRLYPVALETFAKEVSFPVFKGTGVGHGPRNLPLWIGKNARLEKGMLSFL